MNFSNKVEYESPQHSKEASSEIKPPVFATNDQNYQTGGGDSTQLKYENERLKLALAQR